MRARIRDADDIDNMIVYKLSRLARHRVDDALVMADLPQHGVTLIFNDRVGRRHPGAPEGAPLVRLGFELFAVGNRTPLWSWCARCH